jgi:hypothetical protein
VGCGGVGFRGEAETDLVGHDARSPASSSGGMVSLHR